MKYYPKRKEQVKEQAIKRQHETQERTMGIVMNCDPVETAYNLLVDALNNENATVDDLSEAMEDAIGYLGQALAK